MMACMEIAQAQQDVRETFLGGFAGQLVSSLVWFASAAACTWRSFQAGEVVVLLGGCFIFPLTQLLLRAMGHAHALPKGHPMNALGIQVAFSLPPTLLVAIGIGALHPAWFYPAVMIALGAHYLPFAFMYGMAQYLCLGATLIASGFVLTRIPATPLSLGAWLTASILLAFAFLARHVARAKEAPLRKSLA
jgi:hypothetical protein